MRTSALSGSVLAGILALMIFAGSSSANAAPTGCTAGQIRDGSCPTQVGGSTSGDSVVLDGEQTAPGSLPELNPGGGVAAPPRILDWEAIIHPCRLGLNSDDACRGDETDGIPPITIADIAAFTPTPPTQQMEPDGWTVAGLDTNFYAITESHVVPGTLLGRPADVRFTPLAFHWAYGDGSTATLPTPGATWAALGIAEFEPTLTSHVYEQLGDYTITLAVGFGAEYRFDGGAWIPVVGQITLPANDLYLRVGTAKTVLVDRDCLVNPAGPGC